MQCAGPCDPESPRVKLTEEKSPVSLHHIDLTWLHSVESGVASDRFQSTAHNHTHVHLLVSADHTCQWMIFQTLAPRGLAELITSPLLDWQLLFPFLEGQGGKWVVMATEQVHFFSFFSASHDLSFWIIVSVHLSHSFNSLFHSDMP